MTDTVPDRRAEFLALGEPKAAKAPKVQRETLQPVTASWRRQPRRVLSPNYLARVSTLTKNPSVPVRRGVINSPSDEASTARRNM